jgi:hypothetical protein
MTTLLWLTGAPATLAKRGAIQLDRGDGRRGSAAHAVVERDHLRHVGHRDLLAAPPRDQRADDDRRDDELVVGHSRVQERDQRGDDHAGAGPDDSAARGHRRAHALEAEDEQRRGQEIADVDQQSGEKEPRLGHCGFHQCPPPTSSSRPKT